MSDSLETQYELGHGVGFWIQVIRAVLLLTLGLSLIFIPDKTHKVLANAMGLYWLTTGLVLIRRVAHREGNRLFLASATICVGTGLLGVTRDYQYVIVPNSTIGASQVVNYTFPERKYRIHSEIRVAYGSDFDQVRRVVEEAVRGVEGVLPDQLVDALFLEYGHSARRVKVRWWIDNMHRQWNIMDQVNEALEIAFAEAGIEMPVTTRKLIVRHDPETGEELPRSNGEPSSPGKQRGQAACQTRR